MFIISYLLIILVRLKKCAENLHWVSCQKIITKGNRQWQIEYTEDNRQCIQMFCQPHTTKKTNTNLTPEK